MDYTSACLLGVFRCALLMPIEHPLDYMKTQVQAHSYHGPTFSFIKSHIAHYGYLKLYSGFLPNLIRASIKQGYRLPLMVAIPNVYRKVVKNENLIQISTGLTLAVLESYIMCPLERLKVWLMTSPNATLRGFIQDITKINQLLLGIHALLIRQTLSWVTFLGCTSVFKEATLKYQGKLDNTDLLLIGIAVGVVNTAVIMPADFIKTHQQKFKEINSKNIFKLCQFLTASESTTGGKIKMVYCGWKIRVFHYMINSIFTINLVDYIERSLSTRYIQ